MKKSYQKFLFTAICLLFVAGATFGQNSAGPIQIDQFADSDTVEAGDNFALFQDSTYVVKGSYGDIGNAKWVRISYDVFKGDWSGTEYSWNMFVATDTSGVLDGVIDTTFTLPSDAALTDTLLGPPHNAAAALVQVRVDYDPANDTFWNVFVTVAGDTSSTAIEIPQIDGMKLYPNPANAGFFRIETPRSMAKNVKVFGMKGEILTEENLMGNGVVDLSNVPAGYYTVIVKEGEEIGITKVLVQ